MKYRIKVVNDWDSPYYVKDGSSEICRSVDTQEYETGSEELAKTIIRDVLDAPEAELTLEAVKKDFCSNGVEVEAKRLEGIRNYYNGRLAILKGIEADMAAAGPKWSKRYEIPYECNHFEVTEDPSPGERQHDAYVEIERG